MNFLKTKLLPMILIAFTAFVVSGCDSSAGNGTSNGTDPADPIVPSPNVEKILVFAGEGGLRAPMDNNIYLEAVAEFSDGTEPMDISKSATWTSDNADVTVTDGVAYSSVSGTATITAEYEGYTDTQKIQFTDATFSYLELQESYAGPEGTGKVITGSTQELEIVYVNYDPVSPGAYYPTLWAVYDDGSKVYANTERGALWQSSDQTVAQVNSAKGSFVFGRSLGSAVISASYKGETVSFNVDVTKTRDSDLLELAFADGELGWGCTEPHITTLPEIKVRRSHLVQACGNFIDHNTGLTQWIDVNANVLWKSSEPTVARVRQTINSKVQGLSVGDAIITIGFDGVTADLSVTVVD